jgi:FtsP/CotA-like multicopper oxidase with cupredoxin domain
MSTMGPGGSLTINGRRMDMNRVDEQVAAGSTEDWEVSTSGMMGQYEVLR